MTLSNVVKNIIFSVLIIVSVLSVYAAWPISDVSNGQVVDANHINTIRDHTVPSGAVMAFNLGSCPTGWSEYTAGRGRSIIGVGQGNTAEGGGLGTNWALGATTGAETHTLTEAQMPAHNHAATNAAITQNMGYTPSGATYFAATVGGVTVNNANPTGTTGSSQSHNNMQASVALLYCQKS